jgi:hypothetical protein
MWVNHGNFCCWSYQRPMGHPKSSAVRRGIAQLVTEYAYALRSKDGTSFETSHAVSGFSTIEDAIRAATAKAKGGRNGT